MPKKILLRYYSANNLGDDLFIKIITARYREQFVIFSKRCPQFFKEIKNLQVKRNVFWLFITLVFKKLFKDSLVYTKLLAKKSDLLVYVGGSIFIEKGDLARWEKERRFFKGLSCPYYVLGSNFGPFENQEFLPLAEEIIKGAEEVCFRDQRSFERFKYLPNTRLATDLAFAGDLSKYLTKKEGGVVISVMDISRKAEPIVAERYFQLMRQLIGQSLEEGYRVTLMSFCRDEGDEVGIRKVLAETDYQEKVNIYHYDGDLDQALRVLAEAEVVIGTRFHATILGLILKKKVLPIIYSDKTRDILSDMDYKAEMIDFRKETDLDLSKIKIGKLKKFDVSRQQQMGNEQFKKLDEVLDVKI